MDLKGEYEHEYEYEYVLLLELWRLRTPSELNLASMLHMISEARGSKREKRHVFDVGCLPSQPPHHNRIWNIQ